ncbi:hypothetical protein OS493_008542 [Desmophyllum pertusum]|uniref:Fibronectin type-III domain-containing protein n=1 Tax=Desmophyllum pertusum TaxID=174260 RepID=A0A9W9ZR38_9CNID|nr:hypothetical protein OS493_008542 [Desmophyllum pertusum]
MLQNLPSPSLTVVKTLNSTSIEVEWEPVPPQNRLGHITKYVIIYTDEKEEREMNVPAPASKAIVNGLKQSTTYTVKILAATVKGNGPPSDPKTATTEDPPTPWPPSDDDIGTTKVYINFVNKQALSNGKPVRFYQIIVIPLTEGQNPGKSSDGKYVKITRNYDDQVEGQPYVTAEFANEKSQRTTFPVGDGKYYSRAGVTEERRKRRATSYFKYLNGKLDDNTIHYAVFQRSFFDYDEYENEGFITFIITTEFPTGTVVLSVVVGILALIIVVVVIIMWRRFHHDETKTSSRNSRHCSTQEIVEMSASVNLATSQSAYSNPSTDPRYYDNTNLPYYTEPTTEGQATYEVVDGQAANYDDIEPKQEDIYQEIDQGIHYQPLNVNREVHYEGFVKPTAGSAS